MQKLLETAESSLGHGQQVAIASNTMGASTMGLAGVVLGSIMAMHPCTVKVSSC